MIRPIIIRKLSLLGYYGSRSSSIHDLKTGLKNYIEKEFEDCLIDLLKRRIIIISNSSGQPRVSLNPKMRDEINQILR